jgi:D-beta-D-heptose 7-phosphate kinase/D-beta-D-heptose 1-phosphate adenosyltransferase
MKVLVIGDSCYDVFIYGKSDRLCPDAPVPVFIPEKTVSNGGMALNVYENIKSIYSDVDIETNKTQIIKTRYVESKNNHMFLRVDSEKTKLERIGNVKDIRFDLYSAVIISDYCKGYLEEDDIKYICENNDNVFIDTKRVLGEYCVNAKIIKINEVEYNNNLIKCDVLGKLEEKLIVTLGNNGCKYQNNNFPVDDVDIKDMVGAGDSFISGLVIKYLETNDMIESIKFANECATLVVQHKGVNKIGDLL